MGGHVWMESTRITVSVPRSGLVSHFVLVMPYKIILQEFVIKLCHAFVQLDRQTVICLLLNFAGQHCTEDVDECRLQPNTCQNGGTCSNLPGSYVCVCVNGWSGPDCSENIDDCATAACSPGSTCIDRVASFICLCPHGKTGKIYSIFNVYENTRAVQLNR